MKSSTITIRLDPALEKELDQACARSGRTRSDVARDALRRQLACCGSSACASACCRSPSRRAI